MTATPHFEAPWHAQLFALTVALSERGAFGWPEWTRALGEALSRRRLAGDPGGHSGGDQDGDLDGGDDYFAAWLDALETMLARHDLAAKGEAARLHELWRTAYLETPHGHPVRLTERA